MRSIRTIWKKELKDTIRDRRTLMAMIVLPMLLMPAVIIGMGKLVELQAKQAEEKVVKVAVEQRESAPAFVELLGSQEKLELVEISKDIRQAVRDDEIEAGIIIPEGFSELVASQQPASLLVVGKSINTDSSIARSRIQEAVMAYNSQLIAMRLTEQAVDQSILNPVTAASEDLVTEQEAGGFGLSFILPLFIIMWSVVGGQYTAIDISAGEKERKTLESLLLTPVRRLEVVFGKFLAVSTAALVSVVVALGSMYASMLIFGPGLFGAVAGSGDASMELNFSIEPLAFLILFCASIILVLMFSAVQLSIAIFAKSYKEAQSYIGPSYLVVILPVVLVNTLPNFKPVLWFFSLPVVNAVLLFKEVLVGVYDVPHILMTTASLVLFAGLAIYIAVKIYAKESVLFRE
ncbi:MAG: ABC transporter permease [Patescibacteria group bacterium]